MAHDENANDLPEGCREHEGLPLPPLPDTNHTIEFSQWTRITLGKQVFDTRIRGPFSFPAPEENKKG